MTGSVSSPDEHGAISETTPVGPVRRGLNRIGTRLSPDPETLVVERRPTRFLPLDDRLAVTRAFIQPQVSRSGLDRCRGRHGVANLHARMAAAEAQAQETGSPPKAFKAYPPGYVPIDVKYLPPMADPTQRAYRFCAIASNLPLGRCGDF